MSDLTGWQIYADTFSKNPRVQWPALAAIAEFHAATVKKSRRSYWRRKARLLRAEIARQNWTGGAV